jgi:hypothetical protein
MMKADFKVGQRRRTDYSDLRRLLQDGAGDKVLCDAYDALLVSNNCEGAAVGYLAAVGFICHQRPHLAGRLLRRPIDALLQLGAENVEHVNAFVHHLVNASDAYTFAIAAWGGDDGMRWLREAFPHLTDNLGPVFEECWQDLQTRLRAIDRESK